MATQEGRRGGQLLAGSAVLIMPVGENGPVAASALDCFFS